MNLMNNPHSDDFSTTEFDREDQLKYRQINRDFQKLWCGETISLFGDQIMLFALPLIALYECGASNTQAVLLSLALNFPFAILGLLVGAVTERISVRKTMIVSDIVSGIVFGLIWTLAHYHILHYSYLMSLTILAGCAKVFFQIAYASYLPRIMSSEKLLQRSNSKLALSESSSLSLGPMIGAFVTGIFGVVQVMGINALSFVFSAGAVGLIKVREFPREKSQESTRIIRGILRDILSGLTYVWGHPLLFPIISCGTVYVLFLSMVDSIMVLYCLDVMHISVHMIGVIIGLSAVGFPVGNIASVSLSNALGQEKALLVSAVVSISGLGLMPILSQWRGCSGIIGLVGGSILHCMGEGAFNPLALTLRQIYTPTAFLSRVASIHRTLIWGSMALGSLLDSIFISLWGLSSAMWVGGLGTVLCLLCLYSRGLRAAVRSRNSPGCNRYTEVNG